MNLNEALTILALDLGIDANKLIAYAAEDDETGWDMNKGRWPIGSMWGVEGQILYALIRALRPTTVVELGSYYGCSAKHMLMAMSKNRKGKLISVDPAPNPIYKWFTQDEVNRWEMIREKGEDAELPVRADFVLEDAMHSYEMTRDLVMRALSLAPHIILSHDGAHSILGETVRSAFMEVVGEVKTVCADPADCGFAYWIQPGDGA